VWLARRVSPQVAQQITEMQIPAVDIVYEPRRFYPNREVGAHILGFSGLDAKGLEGIEKQFDSDLIGQTQHTIALRDARGGIVLQSGLDPSKRSQGMDIYLTLDIQLSFAVQAALQKVQQKTQAQASMAIVLDVPHAQILAMEGIPSFNPNEGSKIQADLRRNRMVNDLIEPGSTLKPLVMAAALDHKIVHPNKPWFCENGRFLIGKHVITDAHPYGWLMPLTIIAKSSNICMAKIGQKMGASRLYLALKDMHLQERTGVELPYESSGLLRPGKTWSPLEVGTIAFGQGVAISLLQLASAYRALAAGGVWQQPTLVQSLLASDGHVSVPPEPRQKRIFTQETARQVTQMLEAAVASKGATGQLAALKGYRIAGKTGTAQKANPNGQGYSKDDYIALFAGFLPAENPKVVIVVAIDSPKHSHYGGVVAAPVFAEIAAVIMQRMGVMPSENQIPMRIQDAPVTESLSLPQNVPPEQASKKATAQAPASTPHPDLPQFIGLTAHQAVVLFSKSKLPYRLYITGTGKVIRQKLRTLKKGVYQLDLYLEE
jgi:cell division protein FtsI (penicillin-binding protein 3)